MQAAGKLLTQVPEEPWATVCADFVGPLPRSKQGNEMLLVLKVSFSKWTELYYNVPGNKASRLKHHDGNVVHGRAPDQNEEW